MNFITNFPVTLTASVSFTDGRNAAVTLNGRIICIIPAKDKKGNFIKQHSIVRLKTNMLQLEQDGDFSITHVYSAKRVTLPNITNSSLKEINAQIELIKEASSFDLLKELMLPSESNIIELDY